MAGMSDLPVMNVLGIEELPVVWFGAEDEDTQELTLRPSDPFNRPAAPDASLYGTQGPQRRHA
jgi:hypothetical protein